MPVFNLSEDTIARLRAKFEEFQRERGRLHGLLADYVAEYRQFQGSPQERKEYMEGQFSGRALTLSHLLFDGDGAVYWHVKDMAILLGRDQSTLSRTLSAMERSDGWCSRLLSLRKEAKSANGNVIYVYRQEIFDLILDHYEEEYLLRFAEPRRGDRDKAPDINEVRRFWDYLKAGEQIQREHAVLRSAEEWMELRERMELPDLPPMRWRDIFSLIWHKTFNAKTLTFSSLLIAAGIWLAHRWDSALTWLVVAAVLTLLVCAVLIRRRKAAVIFSDLAAVALLSSLTWTAGLLSPEGVIYGANGGTRAPKDEQILELEPTLGEERTVNFAVRSNFYDNLKEVFYRVRPDAEYHSTGFNHLQYPLLVIENPQRDGKITLEVKFVDDKGREKGPWTYSFDLDKERFRLSKDYILHRQESWIEISKTPGSSRRPGTISVSVQLSLKEADPVVRSVVYGINTDQPNIEVPLTKKSPGSARWYSEKILKRSAEGVHSLSSYLIFDDGTSSDIRQTELK